mmetsp:Transcript_26587/g.82205  ORF Transcript_26587/g.82205 Transcript_26587/m.82205 type:complete len:211 (+) Transcript_26587:532-1164(+)
MWTPTVPVTSTRRAPQATRRSPCFVYRSSATHRRLRHSVPSACRVARTTTTACRRRPAPSTPCPPCCRSPAAASMPARCRTSSSHRTDPGKCCCRRRRRRCSRPCICGRRSPVLRPCAASSWHANSGRPASSDDAASAPQFPNKWRSTPASVDSSFANTATQPRQSGSPHHPISAPPFFTPASNSRPATRDVAHACWSATNECRTRVTFH